MKSNSFSIRARGNSFKYACKGVYQFFLSEPNAVLHLLATVLVFFAMLYFDLSRNEIVAMILATGFVWAAELFNTAIERIMDFISPERHSSVAFIKDVSAGAVLIAAITAAVVGAIVFIPKII